MNKKGDITQLPVVLVILFISAIVGILFLGMTLKVTDFWKESGLLNQSEIGMNSNQLIHDTSPPTVDYMIFFLFLGSTIGVTISAVRTNFTPTVMFIFFILLIITILIASGLVNIYSGFTQAEGLIEAGQQMPLTGFVFSRYTPLMMAVMGGFIMLIMWAKSGGEIVN